MWADNNIVRTLSNFHRPEILEAGLKRKRKVNKMRERHQTEVPCPRQNKDYSETFHLIDKGNGAEVKYDLFLENKKHGWTPKLALRLFNMTLNNAYKIYRWLLAKYKSGRRVYSMGEAVEEAAHAFLQRGDSMRKQKPEHPVPVPSLARVHDTGVGRKKRSDAKGTLPGHGRQQDTQPASYLAPLRKKQKTNPWRTHQSFACEKTPGYCAYHGCPNRVLTKSKGKKIQGHYTRMRCEECSAEKGRDVYFCNDFRKGKVVNCHLRWHKENCNSSQNEK